MMNEVFVSDQMDKLIANVSSEKGIFCSKIKLVFIFYYEMQVYANWIFKRSLSVLICFGVTLKNEKDYLKMILNNI